MRVGSGCTNDDVSDTTTNVTGKVDKKTQRAAWTLGDKKTPVYETGLANLTQQQTTVLVHRDGGSVEQMLLVRVQQKEAGGAGGAGATGAPAAADPKIGGAVKDDSGAKGIAAELRGEGITGENVADEASTGEDPAADIARDEIGE